MLCITNWSLFRYFLSCSAFVSTLEGRNRTSMSHLISQFKSSSHPTEMSDIYTLDMLVCGQLLKQHIFVWNYLSHLWPSTETGKRNKLGGRGEWFPPCSKLMKGSTSIILIREWHSLLSFIFFLQYLFLGFYNEQKETEDKMSHISRLLSSWTVLVSHNACEELHHFPV